jgi:hypothetical protein
MLIDIENFDVKEYMKYLLRSKFKDLEDKDHFPYSVLTFYVCVALHLVVREILFYFYGEGSEADFTPVQ